jgi:drug/metabolite transporter, DME family
MKLKFSIPSNSPVSKYSAVIGGPALIVVAALIWSLDAILRADLRTIPASFLVTLEHGLGLIVVFPFLYIYRRQFLDASLKAKAALVFVAILSGALGTIFYTAALARVSFVPFSVVVLMQQLNPLFAITAAWLLLKEKIDGRFLVSGFFALVGAYLMSFPELTPDFESVEGKEQMIAAGLALGAALCWGTGTVFSKIALSEIDFRAATAGRYLVATIAALIFAVVLGETIPLGDVTSKQWTMLIVIVFTAGTVALLFYYKGLAKTEARISAFAELVWPLSAFAIDIARGFEFKETQLVGAALLLIMINRIVLMQAQLNSKVKKK